MVRLLSATWLKPAFRRVSAPRGNDETMRKFIALAALLVLAGCGSSTKTTAPTVTLKHLAAALAEEHEMSKKQAETVLNDLVGMMVKHLKKGERVRIAGFGILQARKRAARMGRNPATGEAIKIKASKRVAFRASKDLKEAV